MAPPEKKMKRKKDEKLTKIKSDPNQLRTINYKGVYYGY